MTRQQNDSTGGQGDNRTPDKTIGQVKYAGDEAGGEQKTKGDSARGSTRTTTADDDRARKSQQAGPAAYAPHEDGERAFPDRDPAKKKTGEF